MSANPTVGPGDIGFVIPLVIVMVQLQKKLGVSRGKKFAKEESSLENQNAPDTAVNEQLMDTHNNCSRTTQEQNWVATFNRYVKRHLTDYGFSSAASARILSSHRRQGAKSTAPADCTPRYLKCHGKPKSRLDLSPLIDACQVIVNTNPRKNIRSFIMRTTRTYMRHQDHRAASMVC
jgi:hypothetical protein